MTFSISNKLYFTLKFSIYILKNEIKTNYFTNKQNLRDNTYNNLHFDFKDLYDITTYHAYFISLLLFIYEHHSGPMQLIINVSQKSRLFIHLKKSPSPF